MEARAAFLAADGEAGLVSVIIPTYNRAHLIAETLHSLLRQHHAQFEAIVVDDGSTDDTAAVVRGFTDPRIRYFQKPNGGLSSARNFGIERARGEFIAFLDSDDLWLDWKLSAQLELFRRHPDVGMIWTDMSAFARPGEIVEERHLRRYYAAYGRIDLTTSWHRAGVLSDLGTNMPRAFGDCPYYVANVLREMLIGNLVHPPTAIVRRERLRQSGPFDPHITGNGAEDYHFYLKVTERGPVAFLDAPSIHYRVHDSQMSVTGLREEARADLRLIEYWLARHPHALSQVERNARLSSSHGWVGSEELYGGNPAAARRHLWQSIRRNPRQLFVAALLATSLLPAGAVPLLRRIKHIAIAWSHPRRLIPIAIAGSGLLYMLYRLVMFAGLQELTGP